MIELIIEKAIRLRMIVIAVFMMIGILAYVSYSSAKIDAIPDIGENQQVVFTKWSGRSPQDIEEQVTYPLSIALQGISGVKGIRAASGFGISMIYVVFKDSVDFYWSRSRIVEKLSSLGEILPEGVQPTIGPDATGLGQIYWYTLINKRDSKNPKSLAQLRTLQDYYVRYRLQSVEGVSEVASIGGFVKEYQIDVDPNKLFAYDIHFTKIVDAIKESNIDVGADVIDQGDREFVIRGKGFFKSTTDIENVVVDVKNGIPIFVKDIATVGTGPAPRRGVLDTNGREAVGGVITMRYGENPVEVIKRIKKELVEIKKGLPAGVELQSFYDRTEVIYRAIDTVKNSLLQEIIITVIVIMLFLLHFRSSLLISLTLPFGVGISFILMKLLKIDSNIMSLSGLVIAIGSMVDMGIIMLENIHSALSERKSNTLSSSERVEIIIRSAREIGPAILIAVMTTIVTFLPVFGLEGSEGKLFIPLAWAKTFAMSGAVLTSIILVPALAVYFLKGELKPLKNNRVSVTIVSVYQRSLLWILNHRLLFISIPVVLFIFGAFAFTRLGKEFMPSLNEGEILYMPVSTQDISVAKAKELLHYTNTIIHDYPLVKSVTGKLGRAETALDPAPVAMLETDIKLIDQSKWPAGMTIQKIMRELDDKLQIPGLVNAWTFPIENRINMISTGIKTQVGIKIFGPDIHVLESLASQIGNEVEKIRGAYGVYAEKIEGKPYVEFNIDRIAASRYGINTGVVNNILQTAVGGMPVGQFYDGRNRFPIRIRYKKELREDIEQLKEVLVPSPLGMHIPMKQLADIRVVTGPAVIQSEHGMLRSLVLLNIRDRDLIGFVEEAQKKISQTIKLPAGYSIVWGGQYENQVRANNRLSLLIPLALLINLLIIYAGIKNFKNSLTIFSAVPIAMSGGLILLWMGGFNTSVAVWVGFIALFGIAVDDGVVLMTYLQQETKLLRPKNWSELVEVIVQAGTRRIRPLVMTTTTTIMALIPVLWSTTTGSEVIKPMAIPAIGGMTVELITLFIIPVVYSWTYMNQINSKKPGGIV